MQTGLGLLKARKGQEAATLGEEGQKSLLGLVAANERIRETEEKIDDARRGLLVAENDYKRTRSDKAFESVQKHRDKIEAMEIRNIEAQNLANSKTAEIQVQVFGKRVDLQGQETQMYGYDTQRASAADTEKSRRAGAMDVVREQSKSHLTGIELQGQNQLAVQRLQNIGINRPGETERIAAQYENILKTQGPDAAEKYMQNVERASGRGKAQGTMSGIADKAHDNVVARMNANAALANKLSDPVLFAAAVTEEQNRLMKAYQQQPSGAGLQKNPDGSFDYVRPK
jgi:hypothetical protein